MSTPTSAAGALRSSTPAGRFAPPAWNAAVVDERRWPLVRVSIGDPGQAGEMVAGLERILAREARFGLIVNGPADVAGLQRLLAAAPGARRRLRQLRPALGTWCAGAAHVMDPCDVVDPIWPAEVIWGCAAEAVGSSAAATAWLRARLLR